MVLHTRGRVGSRHFYRGSPDVHPDVGAFSVKAGCLLSHGSVGEEGLQRIALWQSVPDEGSRSSYGDGGLGRSDG